MGIEDEVEVDHTAQIDDDLEVDIVQDEWNKRAGFLTVEAVRGDADASVIKVVFGVPFGDERVVRRVRRERIAITSGSKAADLDLGDLLASTGLTYDDVGRLLGSEVDAEWEPDSGSDPFVLQTSDRESAEPVGMVESIDDPPAGFAPELYTSITALSNNIVTGFAAFASGEEVEDGIVEVTFELPHGDAEFTRRFARERVADESKYPPLDLLFDAAGVEKTDFEALVMEQFDVEYAGDGEWELANLDYEIEPPSTTTTTTTGDSSSTSSGRSHTSSSSRSRSTTSTTSPASGPAGIVFVALGLSMGLLGLIGGVNEMLAMIEMLETADPATIQPMMMVMDILPHMMVAAIGNMIAQKGMERSNIGR